MGWVRRGGCVEWGTPGRGPLKPGRSSVHCGVGCGMAAQPSPLTPPSCLLLSSGPGCCGVLRVPPGCRPALLHLSPPLPPSAPTPPSTPLAQPLAQDLDAAIKRGRAAKLEIFAVARKATAVPGFGGSSGSGSGSQDGAEAGSSGEDASATSNAGASGAAAEELGGMSDADIEGLDAASMRRLLLGRGLPASGKASKLRERLREARDSA